MKRLVSGALIVGIRAYQLLVSPILGPSCRFMPSCSHYAIEAIQTHGAWRGFVLAVRRIGRCHPFHPGGFDPVPADLTSVSPRATETLRGS